MCLEIDPKKVLIVKDDDADVYVAHTAKEDIKVFKLLKEVDSHYESPYRGMKYEIGKKYHIDEWITEFKPLDRFAVHISEGFHSYIPKDLAVYDFRNDCVVFEAIIPKGSRYFIGRAHDIVSDTLIITDKSMSKYEAYMESIKIDIGDDLIFLKAYNWIIHHSKVGDTELCTMNEKVISDYFINDRTCIMKWGMIAYADGMKELEMNMKIQE